MDARPAGLLLLLLPGLGCTRAVRSEPSTAPVATFAAPGAPRAGRVPAGDGIPLAYTLAGEGDPALVFLHGWGADRSVWRRPMDALAPLHRVVALDLAGHGESGVHREWTVEGLADDVVRVLDALDLRRVVLVGHSMGASIALVAAARTPGRVVAVIGVDALHDVEREESADMSALLAGLERDFVPTCRAFAGSMFGAAAAPPLVSGVQDAMCGARPEIALAVLRAVARFDAASGLERVQVPVRAIQGDRFPTDLEANRRHHADFDVIVLPGTGHFPHLESPEGFERALKEVLRSLS
jgi:pimeloyl-ACP methyl ester carboxylesterase